MTRCYFITGTDTEVGKTYCTASLLRSAANLGIDVVPYKPIAAGCELNEGLWQNDDALTLIEASGTELPYELINPYALPKPIAPHIAAKEMGMVLDIAGVERGLLRLLGRQPQLVLIEGAGGWQLPLSLPQAADEKAQFLSDWVGERQLPVIMVVGVKLGCLNHALLTASAIIQSGATLYGWIANQVDPLMLSYSDNVESLKALLPAPMLTEIPFGGAEPESLNALVKALY